MNKRVSRYVNICMRVYVYSSFRQKVYSSVRLFESPDYDNISACNILAFKLSILVNLSFELDRFPNCLKTAKVIPLYKSKDKTLATNIGQSHH